MFYIHNYIEDTWRSTETWWDLIGYFYREKSDYWWVNDRPFDNIAHNENDKRVDIIDVYKKVYVARSEMIYNDDMEIVNTSEIKKSLKDYKPKEEKYTRRGGRYWNKYPYTFRLDPVPHVGTGRGGGSSWRAPKRNKNYIAKIQEFADDSRARKLKYFVGLWWDDFPYRNEVRSWKNKKKRKQWM